MVPMIFDCHIHMMGESDKAMFAQRLEQAGVAGGVVLSIPPAGFFSDKAKVQSAGSRVKQVIDFTHGNPNLYPFFWIDPTEGDAGEQVEMAAEAGIAGFKVICSHHYPQDERAMKIYERIAKKRLPMLFHSGILYDNAPSGDYNRPCNFEHLFFIDGLRFALAHISWPWCDELIAVFGKWSCLALESKRINSDLYVDLTPGTPPIYREGALRKLLAVDYAPLRDRMIFGTDCKTEYDAAYAQKCVAGDQFIYDTLNVPEDSREKIFHKNLMSFLGRDFQKGE